MDTRMVETESQREDRKHIRINNPDQKGEQLNVLPNRDTRRMIAKSRKLFKHPGAWQYANAQGDKNQPRVNPEKK